jgi:hypothetical protein
MLPTLGRTFRPVRLKNLAAEEKSTDFIKCSLILVKLKKRPFKKKSQNFLSLAEFYGQSGRITLKRIGTIGKRANKCRQIFLQAYFKRKQTNALGSVW